MLPAELLEHLGRLSSHHSEVRSENYKRIWGPHAEEHSVESKAEGEFTQPWAQTIAGWVRPRCTVPAHASLFQLIEAITFGADTAVGHLGGVVQDESAKFDVAVFLSGQQHP